MQGPKKHAYLLRFCGSWILPLRQYSDGFACVELPGCWPRAATEPEGAMQDLLKICGQVPRRVALTRQVQADRFRPVADPQDP